MALKVIDKKMGIIEKTLAAPKTHFTIESLKMEIESLENEKKEIQKVIDDRKALLKEAEAMK